jgi:hypothetical protein
MEYQTLMSRYTELMKWYTEPLPQDRGGDSDVARELDEIECALLDNPPAGCRRGLVLPDEMEYPKELPPLNSLTLEQASIKVMTDDEMLATIARRDRTSPDKYVADVLSQQSVGSCAAEASCGAVMCRRNQDGIKTPKLNAYAMYNTTSGGSDRGSTLHANLAFIQTHGCPSEAVWPRSQGWRTRPSAAAMEDALKYRAAKDGVIEIKNKRELWTMVLSGYPIQFGYTGHSIFCADVLDLNRLIYVNSWAPTWGNNGRGTLEASRVFWGYKVYAVVATRGTN